MICSTCTQRIFGEGTGENGLMILGGIPSSEDIKAGRPFVGKQGALLDSILSSAGISRKETYITTMIKCANPTPNNDEIMSCLDILAEELEEISPQIILCLGEFVAKNLIKDDFVMNRDHGLEYLAPNGMFVIGTYHPQYILSQKGAQLKQAKANIWSDIKKIANAMREIKGKK